MGEIIPFPGAKGSPTAGGGAGQPPTSFGGQVAWQRFEPVWDEQPPHTKTLPPLRELVDFAFSVFYPTEAARASRLQLAYKLSQHKLSKDMANRGGSSAPIARIDQAGPEWVSIPPPYEEAVDIAHDLIADGRPLDAIRIARAFFDSRSYAAALLLEAMWRRSLDLKSMLSGVVRLLRRSLLFDMTSGKPPLYEQGMFDRLQRGIELAKQKGYPIHVELWGSTIPSVASGASRRHGGRFAWANPVLEAAELAVLAHRGPYAEKVVIVLPGSIHVNTLLLSALLMVVEGGDIVIVSKRGERGRKVSLDVPNVLGLPATTQALRVADLSMLNGHLSMRADGGAQTTLVAGGSNRLTDLVKPKSFFQGELPELDLTRIVVGTKGTTPGGGNNIGNRGLFPVRPDWPTTGGGSGGVAASGGIGGVHYYQGGHPSLGDLRPADLLSGAFDPVSPSSGLAASGGLVYDILPVLPVASAVALPGVIVAPPVMALPGVMAVGR